MKKLQGLLEKIYSKYQTLWVRRLALIIFSVLVVSAALSLKALKVDFEFESFFSEDSPELEFYQEHKEKFGYDNDYLLLVLNFDSSVFFPSNLERIEGLTFNLKRLTPVNSIKSIINAPKHIKTPFSIIEKPVVSSDRKILSSELQQEVLNHPLYGQYLGKAGRSSLIFINHKHFDALSAENTFLEEVRTILSQRNFNDYLLVGKSVAQNEFVSYIQQDFILFIILSIILSVIILLILLRSIRLVVFPITIALCTLIFTLSIIAISGAKLSILGILLPAIILFVSTSDAIHFINAIKRHQNIESYLLKLRAALSKVLLPTLLTSLTTAAGFLSLLLMPIQPIKELGLFAALSIVIAFILTFLIGPLLIKSPFGNKKKKISIWWSRLLIFLLRKRIVVFSSFGIIILLSVAAITQLQFDAYLLKDLPEDSKTRTAFEYVDQEFGGSKPLEIAIWSTSKDSDLFSIEVQKEIHKIEEYLLSNYGMSRISSPTTILKYINQTVNGGDISKYQLPDSKEEIDGIPIKRAVRKGDFEKIVTNNGLYGRITGFVPEWGSAKSFDKNRALENFIDHEINKELLAAKITGTTYLIDKSNKAISLQLLVGLGLAVLISAILIGIYFKSLRLLIICIIPNLVPLLFSAAVMAVFGIPLKLTTSILFVIAFGIAIDDSIHMIGYWKNASSQTSIWRFRESIQATGRSIFQTTLIIVSGFIIFTLSSFATTFYLGLFISIALITAVIVDLTLLPLLLFFFDEKRT